MKSHRIRRRLLGANVTFRLYEDGSVKVRVDHPSNDPGTEIEISGRILRHLALNPLWEKGSMTVGPLIWRDDP